MERSSEITLTEGRGTHSVALFHMTVHHVQVVECCFIPSICVFKNIDEFFPYQLN
jgi:hypothetical protein